MPDSLIDFSEATQNAIRLGQLTETARHNDILLQNSELQRQSLAQQQQKMKFDMGTKAYDEIAKLKQDPAIALNPLAQVDLTYAGARALEFGTGMNVPVPSREELLGGYGQINKLLDTMRNPSATEEDRYAALTQAGAANPKWARDFFADMEKAGKLSTQLQDMKIAQEKNKAQLEAMNLKAGKLNLQQNFYGEHISAVGRVLSAVEDPAVRMSYNKALSIKDPQAREIYVSMHPELKSITDKLQTEGVQLPMIQFALGEEVRARKDAYFAAQKRDGVAPAELAEELSGYEMVRKAREVEQEFLADPFNPDAYRNLKKSDQDLRVISQTTVKKLQGLEADRLNLATLKRDDAINKDLKSNFAQEQFLSYLNEGMDDNQAASAAIKQANQKYPGIPMETKDLVNLNKKGKLELGITTKTKSDMEEELISQNLAQQTINELRDVISKNPLAVGAAGNLTRILGGYGQQTMDAARAMFKNDQKIDKDAKAKLSEWFSTAPQDELQALTIGLTYRVARVISGGGTLSDKDIAQAEKMVGALKNSSGSQQALNHLNVIERQLKQRADTAQKVLKTQSPPAPAGTSTETPGTAEEYLKLLGVQ